MPPVQIPFFRVVPSQKTLGWTQNSKVKTIHLIWPVWRELENTASKMNIWQYLRSLLPIDLSLCKHKDGSAWWMEVFKILTVFF